MEVTDFAYNLITYQRSKGHVFKTIKHANLFFVLMQVLMMIYSAAMFQTQYHYAVIVHMINMSFSVLFQISNKIRMNILANFAAEVIAFMAGISFIFMLIQAFIEVDPLVRMFWIINIQYITGPCFMTSITLILMIILKEEANIQPVLINKHKNQQKETNEENSEQQDFLEYAHFILPMSPFV